MNAVENRLDSIEAQIRAQRRDMIVEFDRWWASCGYYGPDTSRVNRSQDVHDSLRAALMEMVALIDQHEAVRVEAIQ